LESDQARDITNIDLHCDKDLAKDHSLDILKLHLLLKAKCCGVEDVDDIGSSDGENTDLFLNSKVYS
jgi:hypothetical protein